MLYLLDANVLIRAHEDYYPLDRVRPFWDWLLAEAEADYAKLPLEIYEEIKPASGPFNDWINDSDVKDLLILDEEVDSGVFNQVIDTAYAPDLTDHELNEAGRDPFLVAYGLMGLERAVVTKEISKPTQQRGRRKLPDACAIMKVPWMTDFQFYRERNFRIP